ncbi:transposase [Erwinia amylovora]|uniref:transposase n=1 Tax=Erwinia amylovora TaxID=552 RepID=UPI001444930B|nr:transposase [Erwinia amylovora]
MRKSRYSEEQITSAIKASEDGTRVNVICDALGISAATLYSWKKKYADLSSEKGRKMRDMEEKLNRIERELQLMSSDKEMLQSVLKHFFTTKDKRQAVNFLQNTYQVGTRRSCRLLDISRSVYHYPNSGEN